MDLICRDCAERLRCVENGVLFVSGGVGRPGDLYRCPECKHEIVAGMSEMVIIGETLDRLIDGFRQRHKTVITR